MEADIGDGLWRIPTLPLKWNPNANWGTATNSTAQTMTRNDP
jgi:hypothetical protein